MGGKRFARFFAVERSTNDSLAVEVGGVPS